MKLATPKEYTRRVFSVFVPVITMVIVWTMLLAQSTNPIALIGVFGGAGVLCVLSWNTLTSSFKLKGD